MGNGALVGGGGGGRRVAETVPLDGEATVAGISAFVALVARTRGGTGGGTRRTAPDREMVAGEARLTVPCGPAVASLLSSLVEGAPSCPPSNRALSAEIRLPGTGGRTRAAPDVELSDTVGARLGGK